MYKDHRYINAGENEIYRYGKKAQERVKAFMQPNDKGFYSFPVDGDRYWTMGTSTGKFGEFMKYGDAFFSVNKGGFAWAKEGTEKGEKFVEFLSAVLEEMKELFVEHCGEKEEDDNE